MTARTPVPQTGEHGHDLALQRLLDLPDLDSVLARLRRLR
jgi:hypothetical protein